VGEPMLEIGKIYQFCGYSNPTFQTLGTINTSTETIHVLFTGEIFILLKIIKGPDSWTPLNWTRYNILTTDGIVCYFEVNDSWVDPPCFKKLQ
jgi:hypothetical protein